MNTVEGLTVLNLRALGGHTIATNPRVSTPLTPCHLPAAQSNDNSILQGWGMGAVSPLSESSPAVGPPCPLSMQHAGDLLRSVVSV